MTPNADIAADAPAAAGRAASQARDTAGVLGVARVFPFYSAAFALVYFFGVYTNFGPVHYYPAIGKITLSPMSDVGPAMMWYGWVLNGAIGGAIASFLALLAPQETVERLVRRWSWLVVALAVGVLAVISYLLRGYFE